jgi:hypothetical protein
MRRLLVILALLGATSCLLPAGEFDSLVREFSRESGATRINIPFFGLARFAVAVGHPAGASELNLAIFENADLEPRRFSELTDYVVARHEWKPMVRVRSRHSESTNIYVQQNGRDLRLLVTALDNREATFVLVRIKPEELMRFIDEHESR